MMVFAVSYMPLFYFYSEDQPVKLLFRYIGLTVS